MLANWASALYIIATVLAAIVVTLAFTGRLGFTAGAGLEKFEHRLETLEGKIKRLRDDCDLLDAKRHEMNKTFTTMIREDHAAWRDEHDTVKDQINTMMIMLTRLEERATENRGRLDELGRRSYDHPKG